MLQASNSSMDAGFFILPYQSLVSATGQFFYRNGIGMASHQDVHMILQCHLTVEAIAGQAACS